MSKIYLHIGMHKAGSSSIQRNLAGYDDGVTKYADLIDVNHSRVFYTVFSGLHKSYDAWHESGLTSDEIEEKREESARLLEKSLKQDIDKNIIFSGEDMSSIPEHGLIKLKEALQTRSKEIYVIIYVRHPVSFIESNIQESIKRGKNTCKPSPPHYKRFEAFVRIFGSDKVIFRYFDRQHLVGQDVVSDFCNVTNVQMKGELIYSNKGVSTEVIRCLYMLNKLISPLEGSSSSNRIVANHAIFCAREKFISLISAVLPGKFIFPREVIAPYLDYQDCEWMQHTMNVDFGLKDTDYRGTCSSKKIRSFFESFEDKTLDCLIDLLRRVGVNADIGRCEERVIHRLFIECLLQVTDLSDFSASRYLELNPDVKAAGVNPYQHFLEYGIKECRRY